MDPGRFWKSWTMKMMLELWWRMKGAQVRFQAAICWWRSVNYEEHALLFATELKKSNGAVQSSSVSSSFPFFFWTWSLSCENALHSGSSLVLDSKTSAVKGNCSMAVQLEGIRYIILIRRSILIESLIYTWMDGGVFLFPVLFSEKRRKQRRGFWEKKKGKHFWKKLEN